MDRDIGATDSVTIGAMNPIRARVRELLEQGALKDDEATQVRAWLEAPSLRWTDWNKLVRVAGGHRRPSQDFVFRAAGSTSDD